MPELWAHCLTCARWFYCGGGQERVCPVCGHTPSVVVDRSTSPPSRVRT